MTDDDIGRIWAKHFPKRGNGHVSEQICRMICLILEKKILLDFAGNYQTGTPQVLSRCRIPPEQFALCRSVGAGEARRV